MNSHALFVKLGLDTNPIAATRLLNAYVLSQTPNSLSHAHQLFDQVPFKDTVLWTSIISAYSRAGNSYKALQLFSHMLQQPHPTQQPNHFVYATVARACGSTTAEFLQLGKTIHARVIKTGFMPNNIVVATSFQDMYAKCSVIDSSRRLFDEMPQRNLISWNSMIAGYVHNGMEIHGLELFYRMKCLEFYLPDEFAIATALAACAWINDLKSGMQVHGYLIATGYESVCVNALCNMYFRCGEVSFAEKVLKGREENAILKLIMIKGYVFNGRYNDVIAYVGRGNNITDIVKVDYSDSHSMEYVAIIGSALIDMYCKCTRIIEARRVFDNLLSAQHVSHWNSIITGYIYNGLLEDASACFKEMPERNVISWTTMISGYVQYGLPREGLSLLAKMYRNKDGITAQGNSFTFATALEACSLLSALEIGNQIHAKLTRTVVNSDINNVVIGTALVDMYSKSGNLNYAQSVFDRMVEKNVVSWTSMITGYAIHGFGSRALEIFQEMMEMHIKPNEVTFISILTACSHCGLAEEGMQYFKLMREKYGMVPRDDHYTCVIDLLGRAGRLVEAWNLLEEIEDGEMGDGYSGETIWGALLGACRLHGNVEMGRRVAEKMLEKKQQVSETYITLSNVYAAAGMWNEAYRVRERWKREGDVVEEPGLSRICVHLGTAGTA